MIITACKKKDKEEFLNENDQVFIDSVRNMVISENDPSAAIIFDVNPDTTLYPSSTVHTDKYFYIDFNLDGVPEFKLNLKFNFTNASTYFSYGELTIETFNNDSYVLSDSIYERKIFNANDSLLSKSFINESYPKVMSENDMIKGKSNWKRGKLLILNTSYSYTSNPPNTPQLNKKTYEGAWLNMDGEYIAVRYKNLCGWIKVGVTGTSTIRIYKYALSRY